MRVELVELLAFRAGGMLVSRLSSIGDWTWLEGSFFDRSLTDFMVPISQLKYIIQHTSRTPNVPISIFEHNPP